MATVEPLEQRLLFSMNDIDVTEALLTQPAAFSYAPTGFNPNTGKNPSKSRIAADMKTLVNQGCNILVTYSMDKTLEWAPKSFKDKGGAYVVAGVYAYDEAQRDRELAAVQRQLPYIDAIRVGNEAVMSGRMSASQLRDLVNQIKHDTGKPVYISEPESVYRDHPELYNVGDLVFANVHPIWANIHDPIQGVQFTKEQVAKLEQASGKKVVLSESWWPSAGGEGFTEQNQAIYFKGLIDAKVPQVYGEAFDQYWKTEGSFSTHWGLNTKTRKPKDVMDEISPVAWQHKVRAVKKGSTLTITGTEFDDVIVGKYEGKKLHLQANRQNYLFSGVKTIRVNARGGNDLVDISQLKTKSAIDGAAGNDTLTGGFGNDTITGGAGRDVLVGNGGKNTLYNDQEDITEPVIPWDETANRIFYNGFDTLDEIVSAGGSFGNGYSWSQGTHSFIKGIQGNALLLDNYGYVSFANALGQSIKKGTISFSFKPYREGIGLADFITSDPDAGRFAFFTRDGLTTTDDWLYFEGNVGGASQFANNGIRTNEWNHVVFTWDTEGEMELYVNGDRGYPWRTSYYLGADAQIRLGMNWWYGPAGKIAIDKFAIHNYVLPEEGITQLYNEFEAGKNTAG